VESKFLEWLEAKRAKGLYSEYDPGEAFETLERRMAQGESFPLAERV
jgi:hypothetical protein